jgi:hypothetical protein
MEPAEILVDGLELNGAQLWGRATRQPDGTYQCYANVDGCLCVVELKVTPPPRQLSLLF